MVVAVAVLVVDVVVARHSNNPGRQPPPGAGSNLRMVLLFPGSSYTHGPLPATVLYSHCRTVVVVVVEAVVVDMDVVVVLVAEVVVPVVVSKRHSRNPVGHTGGFILSYT